MSNRNHDEYGEQSALFREVTEDVEKEQLLMFWKKHGKKAAITIGSIIVVVCSGLGYVLYDKWKIEQNAIAYTKALNDSLYAPEKAQDVFTRLIAEDSDGFALLSRVQMASLKLDKGQKEEGLNDLLAISKDEDVPTPFRNLATTVVAYHYLDEKDKEQEVIDLMTPLATQNGMWRGSAKEIIALSALKKGDNAQAIKLLTENSKDDRLPDSFKVRAKEMLSVIK